MLNKGVMIKFKYLLGLCIFVGTHSQPKSNKSYFTICIYFILNWAVNQQCDWSPSGMGTPHALRPSGSCFTYTVCTESQTDNTTIYVPSVLCYAVYVKKVLLSADYY